MATRETKVTSDEKLDVRKVIQKNWDKYVAQFPGANVDLGLGPRGTVFTSFTEMWRHALSMLVGAPRVESRDGDSRELVGYHAVLHPTAIPWVYSDVRSPSAQYAVGELCWYMSGSDVVAGHIDQYAPSYGQFANWAGMSDGAYGPKIFERVPEIIAELRDRPNSRRAVIALYDNQFLSREGVKDVPCTETLQFIRRGGALHLVVNMRSNDVWMGMVYDVFCFATIQRFVAAELGLVPGYYVHSVGSLHLYDRHNEKAREEVQAPVLVREIVARPDYERICSFSTPGPDDRWSLASKKLVLAEKSLRTAYITSPGGDTRAAKLRTAANLTCRMESYDKAPLTSVLMEALVHYWCDWTNPPLMFPNPRRYRDVHPARAE